jgi:hypothetical protein
MLEGLEGEDREIRQGTKQTVMGTHSFIRYIVTVTVTSLLTTVTNENLQ